MNHWSSPGQNLSIEEASPHGGLVLPPHPALSPRRGNPSVACWKVRRSRTSSAAFGDSVVVLTFLLPSMATAARTKALVQLHHKAPSVSPSPRPARRSLGEGVGEGGVRGQDSSQLFIGFRTSDFGLRISDICDL